MDEATLQMTAELAEELATAHRYASTKDVRVRNFHLKQMGRSPAHCRYAMLSDFDESSLCKRLGSGVHSLLLGGPGLVVYPGKVRRGKEYEAFAALNTGAIICSRSEYETSNRTADAIRRDRLASEVLFSSGVVHETTIEWDWLGRSRRCTPDIVGVDHLAELKTTQNASPDRFKWDVLRFSYTAQLSDYLEAINSVRSRYLRDVYIVAAEKKPPYVVSTYRVAKRDLETGASQCRLWMERLLACEASGNFPGYCESIQDLDLPGSADDLIFGDEEGGES